MLPNVGTIPLVHKMWSFRYSPNAFTETRFEFFKSFYQHWVLGNLALRRTDIWKPLQKIVVRKTLTEQSYIFACFVILHVFVVCWYFSKSTVLINYFRNSIRVSNSFLDYDFGSKLFYKDSQQTTPVGQINFPKYPISISLETKWIKAPIFWSGSSKMNEILYFIFKCFF